MEPKKKILVVGGGFGGIRAAADLSKYADDGTSITLISDKNHFEYHAALYRVVTGRSPLEVCIPLNEVIDEKKVNIVLDEVTSVDLTNKVVIGKETARYNYDYLLLALGSETSYFNIPGLKEHSFGFKSILDALRLKRHLHEIFSKCELSNKEEQVCLVHIVVIGAGASGVELAGELASYTKELAEKHQVDQSYISIDLIEASSRVLPTMSTDVSTMVEKRLRELGVNIYLNRTVVKEEVEEVFMKDMMMKTKTVIWTAGVTSNQVYKNTQGLELNDKQKVLVNDFLQVKSFPEVYVVGDSVSTKYEGMAQTAVSQSKVAAQNILRSIKSEEPLQYEPKRPYYAIPVGTSWAAAIVGSTTVYGYVGWIVRRFADLKFFLSILPLNKALLAFQSGKTLCESCAICSIDEQYS